MSISVAQNIFNTCFSILTKKFEFLGINTSLMEVMLFELVAGLLIYFVYLIFTHN